MEQDRRHTARSGLSRRTLLNLGMGGAAALTLAGCDRFGGGSASAGGAADSINMIWWGDAARSEQTEAMLDVYRGRHSDVTIVTDYADSGPYQDRMATRFAAGDIPDIMNQRRDGLREYADRGTLLNLNDHLDVLDLSDVPDTYPLGRVGDDLYGIPAGLNTVGFIINTDLAGSYGAEVPDHLTWSWDDLWDFSREITEAARSGGDEVYGVDLSFATIQNLVVWVRQAGEDLYTEDGLFGASEETLAAWFEMSVEQRESGGLPPAGFLDVTGSSAAESAIAAGRVAGQVIPTNNLEVHGEVVDGPLQLCRFPGEVQSVRRGMSIDTAMYWSIGAEAPNVEGALDLLNFIVNDAEGNAAVGVTRGLPCSEAVAEEIADSLSEADQESMQYLMDLSEEDLPESRPDPAGGSAVQDMLTEVDEEVQFGRLTPQEAAARLRETADSAMGLA
ncbi:ABC transporter substrate-binding protein [Nesterenkonia xinjiangensis]|uniref:Multiple sugar transport system substrate-binding protein n=1 Tax=Nesterenkonia xinjiangensis TaxID=225327 RepID=A0A7Z0GL09_9MICC|nr:ABC transporter substrate-binding protein [Nesterenkonia xinjiangensis]NYJ77875.1 multiple sugar transport system substrate-binding protein [Nesterenkonia xinjiangensis]